MTDLAVSALVRKRAELLGEIEALEARLDQMRADLVHLHAAIRILDPEADPTLIRPKRANRQGCAWFAQGELGRLILDVLREAGELLTGPPVPRLLSAGRTSRRSTPRRVLGGGGAPSPEDLGYGPRTAPRRPARRPCGWSG